MMASLFSSSKNSVNSDKMSEVNTTPEVVPNVVNDKNSTQNTAENDEIKGEESLKQNNDKDKESPDKIITKEVINDNDNDKEATDNKKVENEEQNNEVKPQSPSQQIQDCRKTSEGDSEDDAAAPKRRRTTSLVADSPCSSVPKRTKSVDNNDVEEVMREKCIAMLLKCLGEGEKAEQTAKNIELAIHEEIGDANDHRYRSRVRSRVANLTRNKAIAKELVNDRLCPRKFAKMSAEELATPQMKELRDHLCEDTMEEHMMGEKEKVGFDNIKKNDTAVETE